MMSQICCNNSCSLPACPSARLHALSARNARFSRRSSFVIPLSLAASEARSEEGISEGVWLDAETEEAEDPQEDSEEEDGEDKGKGKDKDKDEEKSDESAGPEFLEAGSATPSPST